MKIHTSFLATARAFLVATLWTNVLMTGITTLWYTIDALRKAVVLITTQASSLKFLLSAQAILRIPTRCMEMVLLFLAATLHISA